MSKDSNDGIYMCTEEFDKVVSKTNEKWVSEDYMNNLYSPVVTIRRPCPNRGQPCCCTGECLKPLTKNEEISALKLKLDKLESENEKT